MLGKFTALVAVNNTLAVASAGHMHAASSWPSDSLPVSLDNIKNKMEKWTLFETHQKP